MNISFDLFLKSLKPDSHLTIWSNDKSNNKILFSGKAYKLYDNEIIKKWCIVYLMYSLNDISILVEEDWKMEYNYVFTLGYDLLQDLLQAENTPCDVAFEICKSVYTDFLKSEYNKFNHSEYICLSKYIESNYEKIEKYIRSIKKWMI